MRRDKRLANSNNKLLGDKIIVYLGIGVAILAMLVFALLMYGKKLNDDVQNGAMTLEQIASISNNTKEDSKSETQSASTKIGKTVEESENEIDDTDNKDGFVNSTFSKTSEEKDKNNTNINNTNISTNSNPKNDTTNPNDKSKTSEIKNNVENKEKNKDNMNLKELEFAKPIEGKITKEYAKDSLVYSKTLEEWTTHLGIDIEAEKASVVKSSEAGIIKSIKNDPRYGLTIVIDHNNGFQTIYSNLLTSEFVVEGENVEKGQAIGTIGNTAVFEIADEPHLHFEILKDSIQVDPNIYIK